MKGNRTCIGGECSENSGPKKGPQQFLIPRMPVTPNLVLGSASCYHHWEKLIQKQIYLHWEFPVSVFLLFQLMGWEAVSHGIMVADKEVHGSRSSTWKDLWKCILLYSGGVTGDRGLMRRGQTWLTQWQVAGTFLISALRTIWQLLDYLQPLSSPLQCESSSRFLLTCSWRLFYTLHLPSLSLVSSLEQQYCSLHLSFLRTLGACLKDSQLTVIIKGRGVLFSNITAQTNQISVFKKLMFQEQYILLFLTAGDWWDRF